ncbi:MAG: TIGR01212 family radical SAM protein [Acidobacteria bacterium]|nr:TIGR01212 family radical SAM protein [Acidobacteriota bacterium]
MSIPSHPPRYRRLSDELKRRFGERLSKVTINAKMTCPTRDGVLGRGGCTFCDPFGSGPETGASLPIEEQIRRRRRASRPGRYIAYLQAFTNTYCAPSELDSILGRVASQEGVAAIVVGTRPDCVPDPILDLLETWASRIPLWVELGLQSANLRTLREIKRGHTLAEFIDACVRSHARKLMTVAHVILGLPGEGREEWIETARILTALRVGGVKIHMLHIVRGAPLEKAYERGEITLLSREEYVAAVCDFLENLDPDIVIHRLTGERGEPFLVGPQWVREKSTVLQMIREELERRDSWQGKFARLGL